MEDLWYDDASYARYQADPGTTAEEEAHSSFMWSLKFPQCYKHNPLPKMFTKPIQGMECGCSGPKCPETGERLDCNQNCEECPYAEWEASLLLIYGKYGDGIPF